MIYKVSSASTDIAWGLDDEARIVQNVLNLVRTKTWEVPFMRDLGVDSDFIDNTVQYVNDNITDDIIGLIEKYEPRASVLDVSIENLDADGQYDILVELEV